LSKKKKTTVIRNLLKYFAREGRLFFNAETALYSAEENAEADAEMIAAFWVLLDFIEEVEYHTAGDFPVKISFFADGELYEILYAALGRENLIHAAANGERGEAKRIVVVENREQIEAFAITDAVVFCMVGASGEIQYYRRE
jgi:lysophospholipid acyltransferase (LPLAT)-like uncharacterized protein